MDGFFFLVAIAASIAAWVALRRTAELQRSVSGLSRELQRLSESYKVLAAALRPPLETAAQPIVEPATATPPSTPGEALLQSAAGDANPLAIPASNWPRGGSNWKPASSTRTFEQPVQQRGEKPAAQPAERTDVEQALAGRWFVWIGGVAIAMGGLLFVKYAYDSGLIPPVLQIMLGLLAGLALVGAGEWLRRRAQLAEGSAPNYVPAALSAAGLAMLFGSIYAAYALYEIVQPAPAFFGLAAVGLGAIVLSRWQGPFIAALGLLGSYVTPALISSSEPSAWGLFPYLLIILMASLLTLRGRNWWWLGYTAIGGTLLWGLLWINGPFTAADVWPVGLSALAMGLAAMLAIEGPRILRDESGPRPLAEALHPAINIALAGLAAAAVLLAGLVLASAHSGAALFLFTLGLALITFFAWRKPMLELLAPAAALAMLAILMSWRDAAFRAPALNELGLWSQSNFIGPQSQRFLNWMLGSGAAFTLVGISGIFWRQNTWPWGALAAGSSVLFLWGAWIRAGFLLADGTWALLFALTAIAHLFAVLRWSRSQRANDLGAGLLAAAAAALLVLAAGRLLEDIWLTLAVAGLAFAFALMCGALKPRAMGPITVALASLAALRLFVSRELWFGDRGLPMGEHWVLYGYGLPAVLFYAGSRVLRRSAHASAALALEGLSLGLMISLVSLEIRVLIAGGIAYEKPQFLEMAAHILTWAGAAYGLMHRQRLFSSVIAQWGARVLLIMAASGVVGFSLLLFNPVVTGEPVAGGSVFNALLLAYLLPVPLIMLIARRLDVVGWAAFRPVAHVLALVLLFAYVTLETKRLFQGTLLTPWSQSLGETYAYSAVWLVFALALFVAGIRLARQPVRLAGLAVLALVVLKVFIGDMSNLDGLLRIASFIGLGFCLVGIGWLYQRFVDGLPQVRK
ncbi:MAG: DUF2339 domain-containing protein [Aestuariivirga sp.]|uniref:DUF2339 domain-containing protein n=1 Tax=Aestuariivirga sp. TaxID=2650926 RepID=UPI0025C39604|nr:DUF2339 domain-containing protein [Aestuariivirga sp.]MCA3562644.1 DUF2339 domain-containing protein [Aestuariivirga sp.]